MEEGRKGGGEEGRREGGRRDGREEWKGDAIERRGEDEVGRGGGQLGGRRVQGWEGGGREGRMEREVAHLEAVGRAALDVAIRVLLPVYALQVFLLYEDVDAFLSGQNTRHSKERADKNMKI